jgi:hypothetical protein
MLGTLHQMRHHIKTAYGVSQQHYGCIQLPLQGVLQGNGAGPAIWMLISIPLHLKGHFFGLWSNPVARGTGFLQFCLTIRHF